MSWVRWDHFQFSERKQKDLVPSLTPGEHICLAHLSKEFTRNWAWCLVSFSPWGDQTSMCCILPQPVLVPCSLVHPRTGFSTNLRNSYTKLSFSCPRASAFLPDSAISATAVRHKGFDRSKEKGQRVSLSMAEPTLWKSFLKVSKRTQYVFGQSNVFFSTGITIKGY